MWEEIHQGGLRRERELKKWRQKYKQLFQEFCCEGKQRNGANPGEECKVRRKSVDLIICLIIFNWVVNIKHVLKPGRNYSVEREVDLCTYSQFVGGGGGNKCSR